jgi:hypothetical protein
MTTSPNDRALLPIACTLGPSEGAQRVTDWTTLGNDAGLGRERTTGRVVVRFRDLPGIGAELDRLVAAERECCGFLDWQLQRTVDEWQVVITGTEDGLDSLPG